VGEWRITTFAKAPIEIIDGDRGKNYPTQSEFCDTRYCLFLNAGNVTTIGFDFSSCAFISEEKDHLLRKGKLARYDVVLTTRGTVGNSAYFDGSVPYDNIRINSGMVILRAKQSDLHPRYLYLFVRSKLFHDQVSALSTGSAQPQLPIRDIRRIEMPIPPLPEQRAIAHILGTLDDKIELNRKMNQTLEAIARAIFKSWFVDFDPVIYNALAAGKPIPEKFAERAARRAQLAQGKSPLPENIRRLFPDEFQNSELGPIPMGWETESLDQIAHFLNGLALQKYPPGDGPTLPVIKIAQLRKRNTVGADQCNTTVPEDYVVTNGDVLFSWSGSLECVLWTGGKGALNQHLFKVTSQEYPKWFYYFWIHQHLSAFRRVAAGKATTMGHIQRHHLADATVVVPGAKVLETANRQLQPIIDQVLELQIQAHTLVALRDALLSKLIRGEIQVKNAERFISEMK